MASSALPLPGESPERTSVLQAGRLQALLAALAQALTPLDVASAAVEQGMAALGARTGAIWRVDAERQVALQAIAVGPDRDLQERFREIPLEGPLPLPLVDAIRTASPVWIDSEAELAARYPELLHIARGGQFGFVMAALPLHIEGRVIGGLTFTWQTPQTAQEDQRVYELLVAQHCAQALSRAEHFEAERRARAEADRLRERASFLAGASALLASSVEFTPTLTSLAHLVVPRFADWCAIELAAGVGPGAEAVVAHVDPGKVALARQWSRRFPPREDAPTGPQKVLLTGRSELYPEITDAMLVGAARGREHLAVLRELQMRSVMIVPLNARGRTLGVITFIAAEGGHVYGREDLDVAEDLAHRAALAVDNARLLAEAHQATRARDEFLAVASHELRNPLNALQLQILNVRRGAQKRPETVSAAWIEEKLARAGVQVERLVELIDKLLDVSRLSTGRLVLEPEPLDLVELVREVVERQRELLGGVELSLAGAPSVRGEWDRLRIDQVLTNLLHNAGKYGDGKPVVVEVLDGGDHATIAVRDQGIGIAAADQERIFERFERGPAERRYAGFGLGLWISRRVVEAAGGTMRVESSPGRGATFFVELPKHAPALPLDDA